MERNGINWFCDDLFGFVKENRPLGKIENKEKIKKKSSKLGILM